jgi:hypothetical protein
MALQCRCPCDELRCGDPSRFAAASEAEQIMLVAEIGCVALALGGRYSARQTRLLAASLRMLPGMSQLSDSGVDVLLGRAAEHSANGTAWLCETIHRIRSAPLRRLAFRLAALLCSTEGVPGAAQQEYLLALACGFGFSDVQTRELLARAAGWQVTV